MHIDTYIESLVVYAIQKQLAQPEDRTYLINRFLELFGKNDFEHYDEPIIDELEVILDGVLRYAVENGLCEDNITARDLFDTRVMGIITPAPREVIKSFNEKFWVDPEAATDWYYQFSSDTDYIRRYRIAKDMRWKYSSEYGDLDITINLSKPEKDPKAIAAAKNAPQSSYPKCQLCVENEGYAGRMNHPARQNHRVIPITIADSSWCLQYSPYVYYNEHCIVFNSKHVPMVIDRSAFEKLLEFVALFPHYFVGSNADLPIVGGSILSHEHFQGGHYTFAMETSKIEKRIEFSGYNDVEAGIVKWPMSVIRLTANNPQRIAVLADKILSAWREYSDDSVGIIAYSDLEPHNTITPIARRRNKLFELDLVLRCNITSEEHPLGVFHPHQDKHHIKKENIGLIEVMGLAVLPSRLKAELYSLADAVVSGKDICSDADLNKHADWIDDLSKKYAFTESNAVEILMMEMGRKFAGVLEDAGVFKCTPMGRQAFMKFIEYVNSH